ncbi:MAG: acetate kinase [Victivallaceae bacterium]|nr:acetate kinase [Victivallaceae bacterium]
MKILVLNAGSSSVKFTMYSMSQEKMLAKGIVERLGSSKPNLIYKRFDGISEETSPNVKDHIGAIKSICDKLIDPKIGVLKSLKDVEAIGHRVVHGGEQATKPVLISSRVKMIIRDCFPLAPLHNPPNMDGIEAAEKTFPGVPNVAVFDTAFHQSMPPEAYLYAVPYELYTKYGVRKYGFHGTSHAYVGLATAEMLKTTFENLKLITCHLGNGCSMAAINHGSVIDTTMGMTPLEGLVMGTRCGDIDPAVVIRLGELGKTPQEIDHLLNKESGLLGVAGIDSSDMRDIIKATEAGDKQAQRALRMFIRRIVKYIGAYYALLDGADAIVFTGGIGEYSAYVRDKIANSLGAFNIKLDTAANEAAFGKAGIISTPESNCKLIVMPTDEELMIARGVVSTLQQERVTMQATS